MGSLDGLGPAAIGQRARSLLPIREYGTCSGVRVPAPAEPRRLFDRFLLERATPEHSSFEGALAAVHRSWTAPTDDIVIVGGGYGITTVVAARAARSVTVFEPSEERRAHLQTTLRLNAVEAGSVTVRTEGVGTIVSGEAAEKQFPDDVPTIRPEALPRCDVLELDCEGGERAILEGLPPDRRPRVVAVELHPIKLDGATDAVLDALSSMGYAIRQGFTHDGTPIEQEGFHALLAGETPERTAPGHQAYPPVAIATLES